MANPLLSIVPTSTSAEGTHHLARDGGSNCKSDNKQPSAREQDKNNNKRRDEEIGYDDNAILCNLDVEPVKDCP